MGVATAAKLVLVGAEVSVPEGAPLPEGELSPPSVPEGAAEAVEPEPLVVWDPLPDPVPEGALVPVPVGPEVMVGAEAEPVAVPEPPAPAVAEYLTQSSEPTDCATCRSSTLQVAMRQGAAKAPMASWDSQAQAWSVQPALAMAELRQPVLRSRVSIFEVWTSASSPNTRVGAGTGKVRWFG